MGFFVWIPQPDAKPGDIFRANPLFQFALYHAHLPSGGLLTLIAVLAAPAAFDRVARVPCRAA